MLVHRWYFMRNVSRYLKYILSAQNLILLAILATGVSCSLNSDMDCENLPICKFFKEYETNPERQLGLKGFVSLYCKGAKQEICKRKMLCDLLGAAEKVPANMMPNGKALQGTSNAEWGKDVVDGLSELGVRVFRPAFA